MSTSATVWTQRSRRPVWKLSRSWRSAGRNVKEISLPSTKYALSAYYIIASAEASSNLARFDGVKYGYRAKEFYRPHRYV